MRPIYRAGMSPTSGEDPPNPLGRHVVVDLETTGLSPRHGHRIIEIGAVAVEEGAIVNEFTTLVDAGVPIPPTVQAIHGITAEMLEGQPKTEEALLQLFHLHCGQRPHRPQRRLRSHLPAPRIRPAEAGLPQPARLHPGDEPPPSPPPAGLHTGDGLPASLPGRRLTPTEPPRPRRRPDDGENLACDGRGPRMTPAHQQLTFRRLDICSHGNAC